MDIITEHDVILLANNLCTKSGLNLSIVSLTQCSSDFVLAAYLSIMGEVPSGTLVDSSSIDSQEYNISCIINSLSNDYLHVDLSHISPACFVAGDPVTIYNLLEILDGLLDFMLEHLDKQSDSGEEGDIDSDKSSRESILESVKPAFTEKISIKEDHDLIPCHDCSPLDNVNSVDISSKVGPLPSLYGLTSWEPNEVDLISEHTLNSSDITETGTSNQLSSTYITNSKETGTSNQASETFIKNNNLLPDERFSSDKCTLDAQSDKLALTDNQVDLNQESADCKQIPRPMLIDLMEQHDKISGERIIEDMRNSLRLHQSQKFEKDSAEVMPISNSSGKISSGISISDFTSESSKSELDLQPDFLVKPKGYTEKLNTEVSNGADVPDGIPKPEFHRLSSAPSEELSSTDMFDKPIEKHDKDWVKLLNNLQQTVEESKRIRQKYFATPQPASGARCDFSEDETKDDSHIIDSDHNLPVQKNVRFEDTVSSATAERLEKFKKVLEKEKELQNFKNKILSDNFQDHLDEVKEVERRKMQPLLKQSQNTEKELKRSIFQKRKRKPKASAKKDLIAAAKWKSWQSPVVVRTPQARSNKIRKRIDDKMIIGEHDLLPTLISEFPGLELSSTALNNAWKKQFRQIELLSKNETDHGLKKRLSEKRLEEAHNRHHLLIDLMRREHEHNQRVRDARERAVGEQEAVKKVKDRRQQTARVRRYYRDYQLQMRARMLKRRTREEKLFKNLFEEGLKIQRSRLNDLRCYARDKRAEQQIRQQNEIASLENYYKDQFAMLAETLQSEKKDMNTRNNAQSKLLRQMTRGLRKKMENEITNLQEQIARDDDDIYYRELEADRIRRQLQLATYNAKFHASIANKFES